ncbi:MAG: M20 family metallopeptidase [Anaerolineales bacterium]|nr:M20 family metallopeptidase [Anaerolineales bacterium]
MSELLTFLNSARADFLADLAALVNVDCGTHNKTGVDAAGWWVGARCAAWGWMVEQHRLDRYGDCWSARWRGTGAGRVMLMGHLDTVYPDGTADARPMRWDGGRILGPGVNDMKSGLLAGLYALRALQMGGFMDFEELVFFFNSDEEVGSPASRALSGPLAQTMDAVLVLESAREDGALVNARKGCAEYTLTVTGQAAHAGVEPEKGVNAILELAYQIAALHQLNGSAPGVTVNAGVVSGGTATNVVPAEARVEFDVRAVDAAGAARIQRALADLPARVTVPGARVTISGQFSYPPMAQTPAAAYLTELAQAGARTLGFDVHAVATGGASDANLIAGLGVPVLDGLGPVGGRDHSPDEYVLAASLQPRTALVAELVRQILQPDHLRRLRALRGSPPTR